MKKWVYPFLQPWVNSRWWVRLGPHFPSYHQLRGKTEQNVSNSRGNAACACIFWFFPTKPKSNPFPLDSKYPCQNFQTWCQWLLLYGSLIDPGFILHLMFMEHSLHDTPPHLICCIPSGLGVRSVCSGERRRVWKGGWSRHLYHCDVQWRDLHCCIWGCNEPKRSADNRHIHFRG